MNQEWIRIGNYLISSYALDILVPLLSGLIGTVVGGSIAFLSIRASSNRKWHQERKDRLLMERREALASALEWFDPFRMAVMRARLLTESYMRGMINEDGLRSQWPSLIGHPGIKDPPAKLRAWLPANAYNKSIDIIGQFEAEKLRHDLFHQIPNLAEVTVHVDPWAEQPEAVHHLTLHHEPVPQPIRLLQ